MGPSDTSVSLLFVLDASAIVHGAQLPPSQCVTTQGVLDEFTPGGATRRRLDLLLAGGLRVEDVPAGALARVDSTARAAGNLSRLSEADRGAIALALHHGAKLVTDDLTMQDVAQRLNVAVQSISGRPIAATLDWGARCSGCGRTYRAEQAGSECIVCGREVHAKPRRPRTSAP